MSELLKHLYVFALSMVPVIELRGAIPLGAGLGLPIYTNYLVSVVGNFLPVPFILLFIRHILAWMKTTKRFAKIALWLEEKAEKHSDKVLRYATFGLFLFVAIPLPGTGAWTGTLAASFLNMGIKTTSAAVSLGVVIAGIIMGIVSLTGVHVFGL